MYLCASVLSELVLLSDLSYLSLLLCGLYVILFLIDMLVLGLLIVQVL